jgi:hypothetical protein
VTENGGQKNNDKWKSETQTEKFNEMTQKRTNNKQ